ncbi:hypothetical protein [Nonomuraea jabiensis]
MAILELLPLDENRRSESRIRLALLARSAWPTSWRNRCGWGCRT